MHNFVISKIVSGRKSNATYDVVQCMWSLEYSRHNFICVSLVVDHSFYFYGESEL